ncbi:MAG: hypothetical protein GX042_02350 [Bacteroidales bacterium]|jgi:hypothetical protein|nr:hypothetical protein [Bacteroidales bacterium]
MRQFCTQLLLLLFLAFALSCDDSFLKENNKTHEEFDLQATLYVIPSAAFTEVSITLADLKNKDFKVIQYPRIVHFESLKGHIDESGRMAFRIKVDQFESDVRIEPIHLGDIVLDIGNFGYLSIGVAHHNFGNPLLKLNPHLLDFGVSRTPELFTIQNDGNGYLYITITDHPSWLNVTTLSEEPVKNKTYTLHPYSQLELMAVCNRENWAPGVYEGGIVIESNDLSQSQHTLQVQMSVREKGNTDNIIPLPGNVVDCEFNKVTNILYIAESNKNKIYAFDLATSTIVKEMTLTRNVYGLSLSEDNKTLFAGQSARVSVIDAGSLTEISAIETDFITTDVIDGENGYYYFSKKEGDFNSYFYTYNTTTEEISPSGTFIDQMEGSAIVKIKNKPLLLTTRPDSSPNGLTLGDISNGKPTYLKYWHQSFGAKLWQYTDGSVIVGQQGILFKTPSVNTTNPISRIGLLKPKTSSPEDEFGYHYSWLDLSTATRSIWGLYHTIHDDEMPYPRIIEWDDNTYHIRRYVDYEDYYTTVSGVTNFYKTMPHYLFASKDGKSIILVKNLLGDDPHHPVVVVDAWHLEVIDVSNE